MTPPCSSCQTTCKIILVTAVDIIAKNVLFADASKIIHYVILFSDFEGIKLML